MVFGVLLLPVNFGRGAGIAQPVVLVRSSRLTDSYLARLNFRFWSDTP